MTALGLTDEMVEAFNNADFTGLGNADWEDSHVRAGLAAVLALVGRDYDVFPKRYPIVSTAHAELDEEAPADAEPGIRP